MRWKGVALALVLGGLGASSGCAFGTRTVRLPWPAAEGPAPGGPGDLGPAVALAPVVDARPEPRRVIAWVRNGFGMHTADVVTDDDVGRWTWDVVADELRRAGIHLVEPAPGVRTVSVGLRKLHGDAYFGYTAEVLLRVRMSDGDAGLLDEEVRGGASGGINLAATGERFASTVAEAMRSAAARATRAVVGALGGLPQP